MTYYVGAMPVGDHLEHHGIKGMRWGQRRFQNDDGSLTALGRARYGVSNAYGRVRSRVNTARNDIRRAGGVKASAKVSTNVIKRKAKKAGTDTKNFYQKHKKAIKIGAGVAAAAGAAYLGYKYRKQIGAAAKRLGGKTFPAGTKRAQLLSSMKYKSAMGKMNRAAARTGQANLNRMFDEAASAGRKARIGQQINSAFAGMNVGKVRGSVKAKNAFKNAGRVVGSAAKSAGKATGSTVRSVGYHARRAGAKAKNAARNVGYKAGNAPYFMKRAAQNAGSAAKNVASKAAKRPKAYINAAKKYPGAAAVDLAYRGLMGSAYYGHARRRGASKGAAAATGAARAIGGMKYGQAVGAATRVGAGVSKQYKRYNSPKAKAYRAKMKANRAKRKATSK